jgi:hypothetical protein
MVARLNYEAHQNVRDGSVGPRCVVVWRRRRDARPGPGGAHAFYTGLDRESETRAIPAISNGWDAKATSNVIMELFKPQALRMGSGSDRRA